MNKTNKLAILLATYNGEKFVDEQIDSLLKQTYQDWELFIHDDGSKDNTGSVIKQYSEKYPEKIHVLEGPATGGAKSNFFYLMHNVDAPYVMFCDQDDVWLENKVELTMAAMKRAEKENGTDVPILVFSDLMVVDRDLNTIAESMNKYQTLDCRKTSFRDLMIQNIITGCTVMINNKLLEISSKAVDYDKIIMHDWWCGLAAAYYGKIVYLNKSTIRYRQHGDNSVGAKKVFSAGNIMKVIRSGDEVKKSLKMTRDQVAEFIRVYGIDDKIASDYSSLQSMNKVQRLNFYQKNNIKKSGTARNVGLMIWG